MKGDTMKYIQSQSFKKHDVHKGLLPPQNNDTIWLTNQEQAGKHPSTGEPHKCIKCKKPTQPGWGPTMCPECSKKEANSYFDLLKIAQHFDEAIQEPNNDPIPCNSCGEPKPDVEERHSYGIYAGRLCNDCAYKGFRDHCGLVKLPNGRYSDGQQVDTRELEEMGEVVEPEDGGFFS